jgi:hypothetical protein
MKRKRLLVALSLATLALAGASLFVLAGERVPFLARPAPRYCRLLFGPEAKARVLVRFDGEAVSLQHYEGDRPTGRSERFRNPWEFKEVTIPDPDGQTSYRITRMSTPGGKAGEPAELLVSVAIQGPVAYRQYCDIVRMSGDPQGATVAHFHGPLTAQVQTIDWEVPAGLTLVRGEKPTDLCAFVGTMDAAKGCWVVVYSHDAADGKTTPGFPPGVYPVVDVEFPARKRGDPPLRRRYPLDQFC